MTEVIVREAEPADAARATDLLHQLGYPGNSEDDVRLRLRRWAELPASTVLVALVDGRVEGLVAVATIPRFERDGMIGRVVALVVSERCRGTGTGKRLLRAAEGYAAERGCDAVEISSSRHRTGAHAFYRALGYTDRCERSASFVRTFG
ncbi:GNAT family N-acetyltransferase [Umezawaea beigongshangensis]|uniref:GNAT family N-acetyltransferase n=1 Tax=Umezawaea beigongshangensis TaxID=2780383 RepID=UPI0018F150B7|nr:GNAT family N-acetyltransferase [Umezawaea beigongshangensis]